MATTQKAPARLDQLSMRKDPDQILPKKQKGHNENSKADAALAHEVERSLRKDSAFKAIDYENIDVRVSDGIVYLYGHVSSSTNQQRAEKIVRATPGLLGVRNHLVPDDKLVMEVATTLGSLEQAYDCKFFSGATHGVVSLNGIVDDENVKVLAEKYAASNPNVRGVVNGVRVRGSGSNVQNQPFLQPAIGGQIYFLDGVSGRVRQVILNPDNRRVIAMILQGGFTDQQQDLKSLTHDEPRSPQRLVVLAMDLIRFLTKDSGFLYISSNEHKRYVEFEPALFFAPQEEWKVPYPYHPDDVLFPVGQQE